LMKAIIAQMKSYNNKQERKRKKYKKWMGLKI
jgi:predicted RecB family nuclease